MDDLACCLPIQLRPALPALKGPVWLLPRQTRQACEDKQVCWGHPDVGVTPNPQDQLVLSMCRRLVASRTEEGSYGW